MLARSARLALAAALAQAALAPAALSAQKVVVSHDEWLGNDSYLDNATDGKAGQFIANTLSWFGVTGGQSVLLYSDNGVFTGSKLLTELGALGITATQNSGAASFAGYKAVFVGGNATMNAPGLVSYVQGGGNVLYYGGTGTGGSAGEASYSNPFLNAFGFTFLGASYNGVGSANVTANGFAAQGPFGASLFTGVATVGGNNGSELSTVALPAGVTRQLFADATNQGKFVYGAATYAASTVPEPSSYLMLGTGLAALGAVLRRRR